MDKKEEKPKSKPSRCDPFSLSGFGKALEKCKRKERNDSIPLSNTSRHLIQGEKVPSNAEEDQQRPIPTHLKASKQL